MLDHRQNLALAGTVGGEFVGHNDLGHVARALQQLAGEALISLLAAAALDLTDQHIEYVPMLINGWPEVVRLAADVNEHFIQNPLVTELRPVLLRRLGAGPSKALSPLADGLAADHDASRS